jgi:hypothetical protein
MNPEDGSNMFFRKCKSKHKTLRRVKSLPFHGFCLNVRPQFHVTLGSRVFSYETRRVTFSDCTITRLLSSVSNKMQTSSALKAISCAKFSVSSVIYTEVVKKLSRFNYQGRAKQDFNVRTVHTIECTAVDTASWKSKGPMVDPGVTRLYRTCKHYITK